jgi:hypothetical protein
MPSAAIVETQATRNKMAWARDALARAKLTQRDLARVWSTSESSVSRWLDGFQGDMSVARAMQFANLVKMNCCEMMTLLGHPPDIVGEEEQRPVTAQNAPPIPTVHMTPARNGKWHLLLHLELSAHAIAKIVSSLEEAAAERKPPASPPPLKRLDTSPPPHGGTPGTVTG